MNFASSYDLINGPVHSKAAFDRAVGETTVDADVKAWAKEFEDRAWGDERTLKSVTQTGPDTLQFEVTGAKLIADVTIGPESLPASARSYSISTRTHKPNSRRPR